MPLKALYPALGNYWDEKKRIFIPLSVSSQNNRAFDCSLKIALHSSAARLSKSLLHQLKFLQQGGELNYGQLQNQMPSP